MGRLESISIELLGEGEMCVLTVSGDVLDEDLHRLFCFYGRGAGGGRGEAVGTHGGGVGEMAVSVGVSVGVAGVRELGDFSRYR